MLMRDREHDDRINANDVTQCVRKAVEQIPMEPIDDRMSRRRFADRRERALDLALERCGRTFAALEIPSERVAGFALGARVKLDRQGHGSISAREDALTRFGPRDGADFAAFDLAEPALGLFDPCALDLVRGLANAVQEPQGQLGAVFLRELQSFVEQLERVRGHVGSMPRVPASGIGGPPRPCERRAVATHLLQRPHFPPATAVLPRAYAARTRD